MSTINLRKFLAESRDLIDSKGLKRGLLTSAYYSYVGLFNTLTTRRAIGTNVYDKEWDLLVILDACRVDILRELEDEFEFIDGVDSMASVGATSTEWMAKTFTESHQSDVNGTAYVTGNVFSETVFDDEVYPPRGFTTPISAPDWSVCDKSSFGTFDEIWRDEDAWTEYDCETRDESGSYIGPQPLVDRTIQIHREQSPDRTIVHLMQPHTPFVAPVGEFDIEVPVGGTLKRYFSGEFDDDEMWAMYRENTRFVLEWVETLLNSVDAERAVVTADHGECFDGLLGQHQVAHPAPSVKMVPWAETTASDTGEYEPTFEFERDGESSTDEETERRLRDLGYL